MPCSEKNERVVVKKVVEESRKSTTGNGQLLEVSEQHFPQKILVMFLKCRFHLSLLAEKGPNQGKNQVLGSLQENSCSDN